MDDSEDSDSSESLLKVDSVYLTRPKQTINPNTAVRKQWITKLLFNGSNHQRTLKVQLDTGATCNILHSKDYMKLGSRDSSKLKTSDTVLRCYGGEVIKPIGEALLQCKFNHKIYDLIFQVVDTPTYQKPLISAETCTLLDIVRVNAKLCKVQEESLYSSWTEEQIKGEFRDVFEGLGCLPGPPTY